MVAVTVRKDLELTDANYYSRYQRVKDKLSEVDSLLLLTVLSHGGTVHRPFPPDSGIENRPWIEFTNSINYR